MNRAAWLQETRKMRFEEAYGGWQSGRLTQEEVGVCERTFRRHIDWYEDEVMKLVDRYRSRHEGWGAKHFYAWYRRDGGERSYTWVKNQLQEAKLVRKASQRGAHCKRRERSSWRGMMVHQDSSSHA